MNESHTSYLAPKAESRPHPGKGDCGVFARAPIKSGEILALWGGTIVSGADLNPNMPHFTQLVLQIDEDLFMMSARMEPADCFNHSCDPNAGLTGQIGLIAMRDIASGEEICLDYAMCDGMSYDEFDCTCGTALCRGRVTGEDWKRPELWVRYEGYFSPYLQRRIEALKKGNHQQHSTTAVA